MSGRIAWFVGGAPGSRIIDLRTVRAVMRVWWVRRGVGGSGREGRGRGIG